MGFSFLLEDTRVAWMLPLTGAWTKACHLKRTTFWLCKYAAHSLGQIQAVVTNALAKQRYKSAIYIFPYCMDPQHAVLSCSPTPNCLFSLSRLSLSFLPLGSLLRSINRFVSQQMGLKTSTVSPFLNNIALMQMRSQKMGRKQCLGARTCKNTFNQTDRRTDRINTQTGAETHWTMQMAWHKLRRAHTGAETQTACQQRSSIRWEKKNATRLDPSLNKNPHLHLDSSCGDIRSSFSVSQWPLQLV